MHELKRHDWPADDDKEQDEVKTLDDDTATDARAGGNGHGDVDQRDDAPHEQTDAPPPPPNGGYGWVCTGEC